MFLSWADLTQRLGKKNAPKSILAKTTDLTMTLEISSATLDSIAAELVGAADAGAVATTTIVRMA